MVDAMVDEEGSCSSLKTLDLSKNRLNEDGVYMLVEGLDQGMLRHLHHLNLCDVGMTTSSACFLNEVLSGGACCNLKELVVERNTISDAVKVALVETVGRERWCDDHDDDDDDDDEEDSDEGEWIEDEEEDDEDEDEDDDDDDDDEEVEDGDVFGLEGLHGDDEADGSEEEG